MSIYTRVMRSCDLSLSFLFAPAAISELAQHAQTRCESLTWRDAWMVGARMEYAAVQKRCTAFPQLNQGLSKLRSGDSLPAIELCRNERGCVVIAHVSIHRSLRLYDRKPASTECVVLRPTRKREVRELCSLIECAKRGLLSPHGI